MENASKALLIAGEVLIGLIVLSIFAFAFQKAYEFAETIQDRSTQQKIVAFNTQYTKYATGTNRYIYSEDVVTLIEQVINWNKTTAIDSEKIELFVKDETGNVLYSTYNRTEFLEQYKLRGDPSHAEEKEFRFSCNVEMNSSSGRVNKITIQRRGERELEITER